VPNSKERLFTEHQELDSGLSKLSDFLSDSSNLEIVGPLQWGLLYAQHSAMILYRDILAHRLGEWDSD